MTLRDKIRQLANGKGMSLPVLESTLGFGNGTIVRWDKSSPTAEKLKKVADFLGVSVDYLLRDDEIKASRKDRDAELNDIYFSFAKDAQDNGIDPDDIKGIIEIIKRSKGKSGDGDT